MKIALVILLICGMVTSGCGGAAAGTPTMDAPSWASLHGTWVASGPDGRGGKRVLRRILIEETAIEQVIYDPLFVSGQQGGQPVYRSSRYPIEVISTTANRLVISLAGGLEIWTVDPLGPDAIRIGGQQFNREVAAAQAP